MNDRVASSRALGFGLLGIAFWVDSMANAGFAPQAYGGSPAHMLVYAMAVGLLIAAIAAFLRHETWYAFFFMLWSAVSWGGAESAGAGAALAPLTTMGWFLFAIAFVNLYLWLAAMGKHECGPAVSLTVLLATLSLIGAGLNGVLGIWLAGRIGAYIGLATALVAFYVSAEAIMNRTGGRTMKSGGGTENPPVI